MREDVKDMEIMEAETMNIDTMDMDKNPRYRVMFGDVKPLGWLKRELQDNMAGCIGHLDGLVPDLIREHDIYHRERLTRGQKLKDLGRNDSTAPEFEGFEEQFFWWNSETQSNWRDGYCRSAYLLEDETYMKKAAAYVEKILESQEDGYLGIYDRELRFGCTGENGELWAQSTLLRGLLACYEAGKDERLLTHIRIAADCIMAGYPKGSSHPFDLINPFAGVGHGLTIVDSFEWLSRITGQRRYEDYAVWLYEEYSAYSQSEEDLQIKNIEDPFYLFHGHAVHTFEHIRALIIAAYSRPEYMPLLERLLAKLPYYLTPSGAPIGDEWIFGRTADATWTGYEFCTLQELLHTYCLLAKKSGNLLWCEALEWLYFNGAEGMKHPTDSAIMYLKTDNCYSADEYPHPDKDEWNPRYKYSPTHQDAAVCCVPNSGRITPYFIESMLFDWTDGFKVGGYGPYVFHGQWHGVPVVITQKSSYPLELSARFHIKAQAPVRFAMHFRHPSWAKRMIVNGRIYDNACGQCGEIVLEQVWEDCWVDISFECDIQFRTDFRQQTFVTRGPLVYCLEIPAWERIIKEMLVPGFYEKGYSAVSREIETLKIPGAQQANFTWEPIMEVSQLQNAVDPWGALKISGVFWDGENNRTLEMRPMARTILRKVTF